MWLFLYLWLKFKLVPDTWEEEHVQGTLQVEDKPKCWYLFRAFPKKIVTRLPSTATGDTEGSVWGHRPWESLHHQGSA